MKKIKELIIVFENCDCAHIEQKYLKSLFLTSIKHDIMCTNEKDVWKEEYCEMAQFTISKKALQLKTDFDASFIDDKNTLAYHLDNYHDITHLDIRYEDGKNDYIAVPWEGKSDYSNSSEKVVYGEDVFTVSIGFKENIIKKVNKTYIY
jgi:hypothetical protein